MRDTDFYVVLIFGFMISIFLFVRLFYLYFLNAMNYFALKGGMASSGGLEKGAVLLVSSFGPNSLHFCFHQLLHACIRLIICPRVSYLNKFSRYLASMVMWPESKLWSVFFFSDRYSI